MKAGALRDDLADIHVDAELRAPAMRSRHIIARAVAAVIYLAVVTPAALYWSNDWSPDMPGWLSVTWPVVPSVVAGALLKDWRWLWLPLVPLFGSIVYAALGGTGGYVEGWTFFDALTAAVEALGLAVGMTFVQLRRARLVRRRLDAMAP